MADEKTARRRFSLKARYRGFQFSNELTLLLRHVVRLYAHVSDKAHETLSGRRRRHNVTKTHRLLSRRAAPSDRQTGRYAVLGDRGEPGHAEVLIVASAYFAGLCCALQQFVDAFPPSDLLFAYPVESGLVSIP